jgi:hypothetical protein
MSKFRILKFIGTRHPSGEELLGLIDSELSPSALKRMQVHLKNCSICQAEFSSLKQTLQSVQQLHDGRVAELQALQSHGDFESFRARLERHAKDRHANDVAFLPAHKWRSTSWELSSLFRHRLPVFASFLAFALVLATTISLLETKASADVLLTRTEQREEPPTGHSGVSRSILNIAIRNPDSGKEEASSEYVLLADNQTNEARLELESGGHSAGEWTARGDQFYGDLSLKALATHPSFDKTLLHYLQEQNVFPDTSANQFRKLIANRGNTETHVRKGDGSYGLDYVFAEHHPSGIRNAVLWVTKNSYDPFQLSIFVINGTISKEYRVTRKSRVFEKRTLEIAKLFTAPSSALASPPNSLAAHATVVLPWKYVQIPASSDEVQATEILHKLNACLGEEVYVFPMPQGITLVQGLVENTQRQQILTNALAHLDPSVRSEIYTPEQLNSRVQLFPSPYGNLPTAIGKNNAIPPERDVNFSGRQMAFHDELMLNYQNEGKNSEEAEKSVAAFSAELSALSGKLLLNSWALQHLEEEFPASRTTQLTKSDFDALNSLRQEHLQQIRELADREALMLARIPLANSKLSSQNSAITPPGKILKLAQEQEKLVQALFTASQQSARKSEDLSRLVQILQLLEN